MKGLKGLYICLILIMAVNGLNFNLFDGEYDGITMYVTVILFLIASVFYINASHQMKKEQA